MAGWARISRFLRRERGATAVEFAFLMPVMMVCFGAITEGARIYWNYQSVVSGVRDASRYLARITPDTICNGVANPAYVTLPGGAARARAIIDRNVGTGTANLFPLAVTVSSVTAAYSCPDLNLQTDPTPVARVEAKLTIQLPFGSVFEFFGRRSNSRVHTKIIDQSRIYGI
jgi:Flp pilus assembly protein TadG